MTTAKPPLLLATLAAALTLTILPAAAQTGEPGRHAGGARHGRANTPPAESPTAPKPTPEPIQRLDAGAMLCPSEAALQQHQTAIGARLNGTDAPEPTGCRLIQTRTPVAVLERHGPSHTEVRLPGPPEQIGWTDTMIRNP